MKKLLALTLSLASLNLTAMAATLNGTTPASTYGNLLQAPTANVGISTSLIQVQDGLGNSTPFWLATNKSQLDSTLRLVDSTDNTKILQFTLSGITTGTTRTWTWPNSSDTVVGLAATQTLTNKTLTSPVISFITNTGTLTLPTSTDTLVGRATTDTLTNKTLTSPSITSPTISGVITSSGGQVSQIRVVTAAGAVTVATTDYVVEVNKTVGAATTVNLPATPTTGTNFYILDGKGDANTNNITITPASGNINGSTTYVINLAKGCVEIMYDGTQWVVIAEYNGTVI